MESKHVDDSSIVDKVVEYFYEDEDLAKYFEDWCIERAGKIDLTTEENRLEYTSMYKDFLREFQDKMTEFIDMSGSSIEEFYTCLKYREVDSKEDVFVQVLNATMDFDIFITMMREAAEQLESKS